MFLIRNQASQVFVVPGSLRAVADGSAVTTGASLTVVKDGTAAAAAGTLTHISGGAFSYQPTAAETDCKILGYVLGATGAVTVCGSVRTTAADPNNAASLGLTNLDAAVSSRSTYAGGAVASVTGNVGGNVVGSVGSLSGVTFPTRFSSLAIDTDGAVDVATVGGEPASLVTPPLAANLTQWKGGTPNDLVAGRVDANATASLGSTAPAGWINSAAFATGTIVVSDVIRVGGVAIPTPAVAGYLPVDVEKILGTTPVPDPDPIPAVLTAAGLDAVTVDGVNARQALALVLAAEAGKVSGAVSGSTITITIRDLLDTVDRITAIVDGASNRTAVTHNPPA
jgi:hypothetical protein